MLDVEKKLPRRVYACVGGGSNALGIFSGFFDDPVDLVGVEAGGRGLSSGLHASRLKSSDGSPGIAQGYKTYFLQDDDGQVQHTHSISAGLDYAGIGPELAQLHDERRIHFSSVLDSEVLEAFQVLCHEEGIIPALESAHAVARAMQLAPTLPKDHIMVVNISGRGDKDIFITAKHLDTNRWVDFLKSEVEEIENN